MLNILHTKINNIVPIISIEEIFENNYIIQYEDPSSISIEQTQQIEQILFGWPLEKAKIHKLKQLDDIWNNSLSSGFTTNYGWKLGLKNSDVTLLTGAFLLAKEASNLNISQQATVMDTDGVSRTLSIEDLTSLMLAYGQYRTFLSEDYANKKNLINQALSEQELQNIIL